ncbi:MAG: efflux RND transporter periplasmic adaptor subunit [Gammaproteobacteria bacterium]|nr:efflux RND transporter periplasmic adaptor subunit [Gammaproteobacteria bacterium]MCZ6761846.1 efflux RND transporter periplasmic adaptor subunit [Gammaproteobacteria bacterium]
MHFQPLYRRVLFLLPLIVLGACDMQAKDDDDQEAADEEEVAAIPVEVGHPTRGDIFAVYSATAALEADGEAEVVAKVGGEIIELLVEEGDIVKSGQILARLDGDRLRLETRQAKANLSKLEQEYKRNTDLRERGLISADAFENIRYEMDSLRAAYNMARLELSYTEIKAPIDGVVADRYVKIGNTISAEEPVFHVSDMDPLLGYLHVPEREFRKLRPGQPVRISVDAIPDESFSGIVARISPTVSAETGTFKVTVEVAENEGYLKPGMFGRFNIIIDKHEQAILVRSSAIVVGDVETVVYVIEDGVARRRPITTGYTSGGNIEILEGLTGDEEIVVVGQSGLKDGTRISIINPATG